MFEINNNQSQPAAAVAFVEESNNLEEIWNFENDWHSGLCNCCEDFSTCMHALLCWPCFICGLIDDIDESYCISFCVLNNMASMRTKLRSVLRIRVYI